MRRVFFGDALSGGSACPGLLRSTLGTGGCVPFVLAIFGVTVRNDGQKPFTHE